MYLLLSNAADAGSTPLSPWHWLAFAGVLVLLYAGLYYGAPVGKAPPPNIEPRSSLKPVRIARPLILGLVGFLVVDAAVFHSQLYPSILSPKSFAAYVQHLVTRERRPLPPGRNVLVIGDSRVAEGFGAKRADEIAGPGWHFINGAVAGSAARAWYYMLRALDPHRDRYSAIVIPVEYSDVEPRAGTPDQPRDYLERRRDIGLSAPFLRYTDAVTFASSFPSWANRSRAFAVCVIRGFAYQSDIVDLVEHPLQREQALKTKDKMFDAKERYGGRPGNLLKVSFDPQTERLTLPPDFPAAGKAMLEESLAPRSVAGGERWVAYRRRWMGAILRAYRDSETRIVLMQLPRAPFVAASRLGGKEISTLDESVRENDKTIVLDRELFLDLEKPDFFYDALHPNAAGRQRITASLVHELLQRLPTEPAAPR